MQNVFSCEIRNLKGEPVVALETGSWLIRVRFAEGQLPESFKSLKARLGLRVGTSELLPATAPEDGIEPEQGVPQRLTGVVLEHLGDSRLLLDVGILFEVDLGAGLAMPGLGERISCTVEAQPVVFDLQLQPD